MQTIKLIKQLFSKNDAKAIAIFEREQARKSGRSFKKVEIVWALDLYRVNEKLFSKIGKPWDEHYVVVVYYSMKDEGVIKEEVVCEKVNSIDTERANVIVNLRTFTVIKYTSTVVNGEVVKRIERYVVLDGEVKQNKIIQLYKSDALAS